MGYSLVWDKKDNRKASKISISHDIDPMDKHNWDESIQLQLRDVEMLYKVFKYRIENFISNE